MYSQQLVQAATRKLSRILASVDWRIIALSLSGETISPLLLTSSTPILARRGRSLGLYDLDVDLLAP